VQDSWIEGFARDSAFYRATQYFNEQFFGTHTLQILVDTGAIELTGELRAEQIGHHTVDLPVGLIVPPDSLIGCTLRLEPAAASAGDSGGGSGADEEWLPPARRRSRRPWSSRVEGVDVVGDTLRLRLPPRAGSPVYAFRPQAGEAFRFEIRSRRLTLPGTLREIGAFERFIEGFEEYAVGGVLGPAEYVATTNFIVKERQEESRRIPDDPERIDWLWDQYGRVRGEARLRQVIDEDRQRALVTVLMKNANFVDTERLMDAIGVYASEHLHPAGIRVSFAGDVAVSQALIEGVVSTQVRSLLFSLLGILIASMLLTRSVRWSIYYVIPCSLAVAGNFAVMGWVGMPLGVATSMFAGMTLGIGVDFAIHLIERYRISIRRGRSCESALADALATTGPAIAIDGLAIAVGFGVLVFSQVPANGRLGLLTVVSIVNCMLATLFLLPTLLSVAATRRSD
jgi:hypothetical protein